MQQDYNLGVVVGEGGRDSCNKALQNCVKPIFCLKKLLELLVFSRNRESKKKEQRENSVSVQKEANSGSFLGDIKITLVIISVIRAKDSTVSIHFLLFAT